MTRRDRWRGVAALATALTLLGSAQGAIAAPGVGLGGAGDYVEDRPAELRFGNTGRWFVQLQGAPTAAGGKLSVIRGQQEKFRRDVVADDIEVEVDRTYRDLFNGFAVTAEADGAAAIASLPGVEAVFPIRPVAIPEPQRNSSPQLYTAIQMTGADIVQDTLGFKGAGIKVGVIDTGIDFTHPDLGGAGAGTAFPTVRVAYGYDFVGDDYDSDPTSPDYQPVPRPDPVPNDCNGHGTHVAGIVGASGSVTGVAPEVTLGAYRVFGCGGAADDAVILAALERAFSDGMDVVNLSLGSGFDSWPTTPTAAAANLLATAGMVVVASAGNDGDAFTQATGGPSTGAGVISVASYDNVAVLLKEMVAHVAGGADLSIGYNQAAASPEATGALDGKALVGTTDPVGCTVETADLTGRVAIVRRGSCTFHQKALMAQEAGADALVIANNAPGFLTPTVAGAEEITIPVVAITQAQGDDLLAAVTVDAVTVEFPGTTTSQPNPTGGLVSDFSSWGLAADLSLKPDLGAPGGSIYSTVPLALGGHDTYSGTSMAAPHVAGAAALMLEADHALTPRQIRDRLQNTAARTMFSYAPDLGILDAAHHQGAGLIRIDRAILEPTAVSPGKISAGESDDGPFTQRLTLTNSSDEPITYTLDHEDAVSTYVDPDDPEATQDDVQFELYESQVTFSAATVTVPAHGTATVDVTIDADPEAVEGTQYSGFVLLLPEEGGDPIGIPFAGMAGDYGSLDVFPALEMDLPALAVITQCAIWSDGQCADGEFDYAPDDHNYELGHDLPTVVLRLAYPVRSLDLQVLQVDAAGDPVEDSARSAYKVDYRGRDGGLMAWSWDGRLAGDDGLVTEVVPGQYVIRMVATGADGDGGTQSWTSKPFGVRNAIQPSPSPSPSPSQPPVDIYTTPGYHHVNGRDWFTICEPYSRTTRCRTDIVATQVTQVKGRFVVRKGWVFNNLTYLAAPRTLWGGNPLANPGEWRASDGRSWRTECNTPVTGGNGCRSYTRSSVIESAPGGGYRWTNKWVFNNIVRFS